MTPAASLPPPALGFAILWAALPQVVQFVAVTAVMGTVAVLAARRDQRAIPELLEELNVLTIPLGTATTLLVAVVVTWVLFPGRVGRCLGWRNPAWPQWMGTLLMVLPLGIIASEAGNWATEGIGRLEPSWAADFRRSSGELLEQFARADWLLLLCGGCIFPGLGEEIYFRGFLSRGLVARHGVIGGTLLASLLFSAAHLDPVHASSVFLMGLGLQYVFLTTRSLLAPIALHTLNNVAALLVLRYRDVFPVRGLSPMPEGVVVHTPLPLALAAVLSLAAVAGLLFQIRTRWVLPDGSAWSPGYVTAERPPMEEATPVSAPASAWAWALIAGPYAALIATLYLAHRWSAASFS